MYTADEVIDDLQTTVGIQGEVVARGKNTVTREYAAYWDIGHGAAHKTGYVRWSETETLDERGELDQVERMTLEFSED